MAPAMPNSPKESTWRDVVASIYSERTGCFATDARYIARILEPVLGVLSPAEAVDAVTSAPEFVGELGVPLRRP